MDHVRKHLGQLHELKNVVKEKIRNILNILLLIIMILQRKQFQL